MTAGDGGVRREDAAGGTVDVLFLGMWLERPDVYKKSAVRDAAQPVVLE